jgi:hypothetical protein
MRNLKLKKRKIFVLAVGLVFLLTANLNYVLADGIMIEPEPEATVWDQWMGPEVNGQTLSVGQVVGQTSQQAFISWDSKNKTEKMMIIVDKEKSNDFNRFRKINYYPLNRQSQNSLFWIIPIKSKCEDIKPYHYDKFSERIEVISAADEAKNRLKTLREIVFGMQGWPLLGKLTLKKERYQQSLGLQKEAVDLSFGRAYNTVREAVKVYTYIESFGVKTEVLSAQSSEALDKYLADNGMKLNQEVKDLLNDYINSDYCFAVSKVLSPDEKGKLGVLLEFKPDKIFYPLYITSGYGQKKIRVEIFANGVKETKMGQRKLDASFLYLKDDFTYGKDEEKFFKKGDIVTKVNLYEPASNFTADIYFQNNFLKAFKVYFGLYLWLTMIAVLFLLSFALAWLLFRREWLKVGLLNGLLGIVGLIIGAGGQKFKNMFKFKKGEGALRKSEYRYLKEIFTWNKIIMYLPILFLFIVPILIFGSYDVRDFIGDFLESMLGRNDEFIFLFFAVILPISFLVSLSSVLMKKIISAYEVPGATRKLLVDILRFIINLFEAVVLFAAVVLFIVMGPTGWLLGAAAVLILAVFMVRQNFIRKETILAFGPIITLGLAFINVFGALVFLFAIFPYLSVVYFSKNSQKIENYLKELSSTKETDQDIGEAVSYSSVVGKVIIYSVLFVLLYIAIEALFKLVI